VRATDELVGKAAEHTFPPFPQLMPDGELVMDPSPEPAVISTERLLVAVVVGHPSLAGPCTVTVMKPTTTLPLMLPPSV